MKAKWRVANSSRPGHATIFYFLTRDTTRPAFTVCSIRVDRGIEIASERGCEVEYRKDSSGKLITYRTFQKAQAAADRLNAASGE